MSEPALSVFDSAEIVFPEGIIGVPRARRFHLLERTDSPIRFLQSLDIQGFRLPVVDPYLADPDYRPRLGSRANASLGFDDPQQILLLAIANVTEEGAVANLRAPLIINVERRCGVQVILDDLRHGLRAPVRLEAATVSS